MRVVLELLLRDVECVLLRELYCPETFLKCFDAVVPNALLPVLSQLGGVRATDLQWRHVLERLPGDIVVHRKANLLGGWKSYTLLISGFQLLLLFS